MTYARHYQVKQLILAVKINNAHILERTQTVPTANAAFYSSHIGTLILNSLAAANSFYSRATPRHSSIVDLANVHS